MILDNGKVDINNMKKIVRLTESDLHNIIEESIKNVLNESTNLGAYESLEEARKLLIGITKSGFIPFASPSPSSTENELKMSIIEAARLIDKSLYLCGQLGYNQPRVNFA